MRTRRGDPGAGGAEADRASLAPDRNPVADRRISRETLTTRIEEALRLDIIDGVLEPGQRLRLEILAQEYGVSPTPIREALQRLAAENFVTLDPRVGASVAPISAVELREVYWMRDLLESAALRRSIEEGDAVWQETVQSAWADFMPLLAEGRSNILAWSRAHRAFHAATMSGATSRWLGQFASVLQNQSERYQILSVKTASRDSLAEHQSIFQAVMSGDAEGAVAAHRNHLMTTVSLLEPGLLAQSTTTNLQPREPGSASTARMDTTETGT